VAGDVLRPAIHVGRADRLVRLLGVLGRRFVDARRLRQVFYGVDAVDVEPAGGDGLVGERHAIGSHVGDEADRLAAQVDALVELLRDAHGATGGEADLARGLLLQGRGREGREGVAAEGFAPDAGNL